MQATSIGRIVDFVTLTEEQLVTLPSKIARLLTYHQRGVAVPSRGFVIFSTVVEQIIEALHQDGQFTPLLERELLAAYRAVGFEADGVRIAVRGALSIEDQSNASWAGGSESPTNILGEAQFLDAVLTCIRETFNGKMDGYQQRLGLGGELKLCILVHEMARTDRFAIVFTRNPLNGSPDEIVIQSTFGGGQLLTAGTETGDVFILDRKGTIRSAVITTKEKMVTATGLIEMPNHLKDAASLEPVHLKTLLEFVLMVEQLEGGVYQDCEVAVAIGTANEAICTLVQSRPVTTADDAPGLVRYHAISTAKAAAENEQICLSQLGVPALPDVFSDQNIAELLTQHPTQFAFGLFTYIFAHGGGICTGRNMMGYDIGAELDTGFFQLIGSQPRCSIVHDAMTYRIKGVPLNDYVRLIRYYLERISQDERLANYPEVVLYEQNPSMELLTELFGSAKAIQYRQCYEEFFAGIRRWERTFADVYLQTYEPELVEFVTQQRALADFDLSPELVASLQVKLDFLREKICVWFVAVARLGFFAYARLRRTLEAMFDSATAKELLDHLTAGLPDDPTIDFNVALAELKAGLLTRDAVLVQYGHLGFNELEISGPRYHEQPAVIDQLAAAIKSDPHEEFAHRVGDYERTYQRVWSRLNELARQEFEQDVVSARTYLAMRERVKFNYLKVYDLIRQQLRRAEQQLGWDQGLVFFLDPREINLLTADPEHALHLATKRRQRRAREIDLDVPQVLTMGQFSSIGMEEIPEGATELSGIGVTSYVIEGPAVVVHSPQDHEALVHMTDGCVLVARTTDPTWAPVIGAVGKGGLITEVGGVLAHGAITSRELGIAAVLNVKHATKLIKTGQRVRVDGPAQKVFILD